MSSAESIQEKPEEGQELGLAKLGLSATISATQKSPQGVTGEWLWAPPDIAEKVEELTRTPSDINEHLPVLVDMARECETVLGTGVRGGPSSWALLQGMMQNPRLGEPGAWRRFCFMLNDLEICDVRELAAVGINSPISLHAKWCNNLALEFEEGESQDMVFIDTWHVQGQLRRELEKFAPVTNKWIVMHDTETDGETGEIMRLTSIGSAEEREDIIRRFVEEFGWEREDFTTGLLRAVNEFLQRHPEWRVRAHQPNCNGLTVLERR